MGVDPLELARFATVGAGIVLMIFALGAQAGWLWAVKSLRVRRPLWITAILAAAGACLSIFFALGGDWLSAVLTAALYVLLVATDLGLGRFSRAIRQP